MMKVISSITYRFSFVAFVALGALPTTMFSRYSSRLYSKCCSQIYDYFPYLLSRYAVRSLELVQTLLVSNQ